MCLLCGSSFASERTALINQMPHCHVLDHYRSWHSNHRESPLWFHRTACPATPPPPPYILNQSSSCPTRFKPPHCHIPPDHSPQHSHHIKISIKIPQRRYHPPQIHTCESRQRVLPVRGASYGMVVTTVVNRANPPPPPPHPSRYIRTDSPKKVPTLNSLSIIHEVF